MDNISLFSIEDEIEAQEISTKELNSLCRDLQDLREINREFAQLVEQQGDSVQGISQAIEASKVHMREGNSQLRMAQEEQEKYRKYRMIIGVSVGLCAAGPVGALLGVKIGACVFCFTSLVSAFL